MLDLKLKSSATVLFLLMFLFLPFSSLGKDVTTKLKNQITKVQETDKKKSIFGEITLAQLTAFLLAVGAVGTAAMAASESFKSGLLPPMGFKHLKKSISWADKALKVAYEEEYLDLLESLYRQNRSKGDLPRILRQGVRIGMNTKTARELASIVGDCTPEDLEEVARKVAAGELLGKEEKENAEPKMDKATARNILGRFEMAADARIDAALSLAERHYINGIRFGAFVWAIVLSMASALIIGNHEGDVFKYLVHGIIVGFIAVPIAPIAKDLTKGLQSATRAVKAIK